MVQINSVQHDINTSAQLSSLWSVVLKANSWSDLLSILLTITTEMFSVTLLSFLNTLYFCSTSSARVLTYLAPRHCCIISSLFSLSKDLFKCSSVVGRWIQAALWCFELAIQTSSFRKKTPYSIINSPQ